MDSSETAIIAAGPYSGRCTFDRSLFMHTNLERVDFTDSTGCSIDVLANELKGARFSRYEAIHLLESLGIELVD